MLAEIGSIGISVLRWRSATLEWKFARYQSTEAILSGSIQRARRLLATTHQ